MTHLSNFYDPIPFYRKAKYEKVIFIESHNRPVTEKPDNATTKIDKA